MEKTAKKPRTNRNKEMCKLYMRANNELAQALYPYIERGADEVQADGELLELHERRAAVADLIIYTFMTKEGFTYDDDRMMWSQKEGGTI